MALEGEALPREAIGEALDNVALSRQRALPARVLSQGQRRRIGLARLSLLPRPLWILDEPVTALDAAGAELLARIVAGHLAKGGLAVAATHAPLGLPESRVRPLALGLMHECRSPAPPPALPGAAGRRLARGPLGRRARPQARAALARGTRRAIAVLRDRGLALSARDDARAQHCSRRWGPACCGSPRCWPRCCRCRACSPATTPTARWSRSRCRRIRSSALVSGKIVAHWLTTGLPVVLLAPLLGLQYALDGEALAVLTAALLIGTPILSLLGAIGAALTLGLRASGSLLALLILPLYVPVLIFGAGAVDAARSGLGAAREPFAARRGAAGRDGRRAVRRRGRRAHRARLKPELHVAQLVQIRVARHLLPARREDDPVVRAVRRPLLAVVGLYIGLVVAPTDFQQGDAYRIIFIHVPAAWMSMFLYVVMACWSALALGFNTRLSAMMAQAIAPTGALMTFIALWTGAFWGRPTWGTYWAWDARMTSELILLFLYLGIIALRNAIDDPRRADRACGVLALIGVVNIPIIYFSVQWWNTLHQGSSVSLTKAPAMAAIMLTGMLIMSFAAWFYAIAASLARVRIIMLERERGAAWVGDADGSEERMSDILRDGRLRLLRLERVRRRGAGARHRAARAAVAPQVGAAGSAAHAARRPRPIRREPPNEAPSPPLRVDRRRRAGARRRGRRWC